jgi:serine/threonine-protein kinase
MGVHDSPAMAVLPPPIAARTAVPGVTGQTDGAARTAITGAGLTVGTITADNSCQVDPGIVTGQSPAAGISARLGDPVSLSESSGKTPQGGPCHPVLPSLFGFDDKTAQNTITGLGLVVGQVTTGSNCAVSKGDVFSQNPGPGPVAPGTVVSLAESNGLDQHNKPCNIQ